MFLMRYPPYKRQYTGGTIDNPASWLTAEGAFTGSTLSRIGHLNDCFMSSETDVGTYSPEGRAAELAYLGAEGPFTAWGGETCSESEYNSCVHTLSDAAILHINFLNADYNQTVHAVWEEEGCYDEVSRRLGYRFVLRSAKLPAAVRPGGILRIEAVIENAGFGNLYNPRPVEIVLLNNDTGDALAAGISTDPRFWTAGQTTDLLARLRIPGDLAEGTWSVAIRLPDASPSIRGDHRFAVRFANDDVWDEATASNILVTNLVIDDSAPGSADPAFLVFAEIEP